jgi:LacI family transcriptional regulator
VAKRKSFERPTLEDVAVLANVSRTTASFILRQQEPHFSRHAKETIERVRRAASEVGYLPDMMASSLRRGHKPFFGVCFEFVRQRDFSPRGGQPSVMWEVFEGIARGGESQSRYPVFLTGRSPEGRDDRIDELDQLVRSGMSGVIAAVHRPMWKRYMARWEQAGVPCVSLFDAGEPDQSRWYVDLDNRAVGRLAWEHLTRAGHRRIICLRDRDLEQAAADRIDAFCTAQNDAGVESFILQLHGWNESIGKDDPRDADLLMDALRRTRATAMFGNSGGVSLIAFRELTARGVRIPDDCSLIGIDIPPHQPAKQAMTEVICPGEQIGIEAARLLAGRIDGTLRERTYRLVEPIIDERQSVAGV